MPATVFDRFTCRAEEVTTHLTELSIALTVPAGPFTTDSHGWSTHDREIDRAGLAWCTAVTLRTLLRPWGRS